ncbi:hypothetical protein Taro_012064 [Colocasia esculenta]|uniref:Uncharacterized protein n=1 Tax=Colocasia esculenta TaxID=4460 RepID=A0A843U800_COLES|nr:hypothetical protein [Colocasia esculenta]
MVCQVASTLYAPNTRQSHYDRKDSGQIVQKSSHDAFRRHDKNMTPTSVVTSVSIVTLRTGSRAQEGRRRKEEDEEHKRKEVEEEQKRKREEEEEEKRKEKEEEKKRKEAEKKRMEAEEAEKKRKEEEEKEKRKMEEEEKKRKRHHISPSSLSRRVTAETRKRRQLEIYTSTDTLLTGKKEGRRDYVAREVLGVDEKS